MTNPESLVKYFSNSREFYEYLHEIIDLLVGRLGPITQKYIPNVFPDENGFNVTLEAWKYAMPLLLDIRRKNEIAKKFSEEQQKVVQEVLETRRAELRNAVIHNAIKPNRLESFDWKLKQVLASDKLSVINEPLAELMLELSDNGSKRVISIEMDKEELSDLLRTLEAAQDKLKRVY